MNNVAKRPGSAAPRRSLPTLSCRRSRLTHACRGAAVVASALVLGACSSLPIKRQIDVDVLWYNAGTAGPGQGSSRTNVRVEPNPEDKIRVGVIESASLQTGKMWRAAIWMAAFQAAVATNQDPADWLVSVEVDNLGDRIDGPSAGGLLTAAMMAGMLGANADANFSMTGTVNPDGTIGPVSGIPNKFSAAVNNGKRVLGFPLGQGKARDLKTKAMVDLKTRFGSDNVRLVEMKDVGDAYEALTGRSLKGPAPLPVAAMALPDNVAKAMTEQTKHWLGGAQRTYRDFEALKLNNPALKRRWEVVNRNFGLAESLLKKGRVSAAYLRSAGMFAAADSALLLARIVSDVGKNELIAARNFANGVFESVDSRMADTIKRFKDIEPRSASDLMTLIDGYEAFGEAVRYLGDAIKERQKSNRELQVIGLGLKAKKLKVDNKLKARLIRLLYEPLEAIINANVNTVIAKQSLEFRPAADESERGNRKRSQASQGRVERLGQLLRVAAGANKTYFETIALEPMANKIKISVSDARVRFKDPTWQHIRHDPRMLHSILEEHLGGNSFPLSIFDLSTAFNIYIGAATLIAKYYSLDMKLNDGRITAVGRKKAFATMLTLAEEKAREHAARAKRAVGDVPVAARIAYQTGRAFEELGGAESRADALEQYWRSSMFSQLAVILRKRVSADAEPAVGTGPEQPTRGASLSAGASASP